MRHNVFGTGGGGGTNWRPPPVLRSFERSSKTNCLFFRPSNITLKDQNVEPFEMAFLRPTKIKML